ncbi:MAG TPA: hypothetical protein EYM37_04240 [Methylophaga aminisulfidivorans]|uniref:hypothetical protein n=1 Tax=Methylophaga TaxID=40222 RepID=UPI001764FE3F|nr:MULTISPECIES: hypothetical protein [Methylophaga]HIC46978.1 hypothetical protein [Methylophaga sp.]HIM39130.1 hypothetical protein [Methylophaga aminisulfidivorans]
MANNLFISYDLYSPHQDYSATIEAIKNLGPWAAVQKSLWYVNANYTAEQAAKIVREKQDPNDSLIVIDASNKDAYWYNISEEVAKHIQDYWFR